MDTHLVDTDQTKTDYQDNWQGSMFSKWRPKDIVTRERKELLFAEVKYRRVSLEQGDNSTYD